jgi:hypothetical protein
LRAGLSLREGRSVLDLLRRSLARIASGSVSQEMGLSMPSSSRSSADKACAFHSEGRRRIGEASSSWREGESTRIDGEGGLCVPPEPADSTASFFAELTWCTILANVGKISPLPAKLEPY